MAEVGPSDAPLIDLLDIPELLTFSPVTLPGGGAGWRFGAGLTWEAIQQSADLPDGLALWRTVAAGFVSQAVRAAATLGGSLMVSTGDARLALAVCGGSVTYRTRDGMEHTTTEAPADVLLRQLDVPVPDQSFWVGLGARGARRDRAGLALWFSNGQCTGGRLFRRIGAAAPERLAAVEQVCPGATAAELPNRLRAAADGCPLVILLARRLAGAREA